jgi:hypothetical protein
MASQDSDMRSLLIDILDFIKNAPINSSNPRHIKMWMDKLGEFLCAIKRVVEDLPLPNSYRLIGTHTNDEMIGVVIVNLSRLNIPTNEEGEMWTLRWLPDFIGYINYLFGLFEDLTDYRVDVPKWTHNNNHSWLL